MKYIIALLALTTLSFSAPKPQSPLFQLDSDEAFVSKFYAHLPADVLPHRQGYLVKVTPAQYDAGYDALTPAELAAISAAIDIITEKSDDLKKAENALIVLAREVEIIDPAGVAMPADGEKHLRGYLRNLARSKNASDKAKAKGLVAEVQMAMDDVKFHGGVIEDAVYHADLGDEDDITLPPVPKPPKPPREQGN